MKPERRQGPEPTEGPGASGQGCPRQTHDSPLVFGWWLPYPRVSHSPHEVLPALLTVCLRTRDGPHVLGSPKATKAVFVPGLEQDPPPGEDLGEWAAFVPVSCRIAVTWLSVTPQVGFNFQARSLPPWNRAQFQTLHLSLISPCSAHVETGLIPFTSCA